LEAPQIEDDFYLNLVDWSSQNVLAVGLGNSVYMWNAATSQVSKLCEMPSGDSVTSVSWIERGTHLAVGSNNGTVQIWDVSRKKQIREMGGHRSRVGSLAWNSALLSSGSRDKVIFHRDVRVNTPYVTKLVGHRQEVCGLKWSYDGTQLASGGNDNKLYIWDATSTSPLLKFQHHIAAVKAISWSPHQRGLLVSGGGTADKCIRFWSTLTNTPLHFVDTGSQVCNLAWSKNVNELVSTHGYSQNQVVVWSYPSMSQVATLTGHTMRVLYLAVAPDGQTIVTGAGDETLRFWNVFPDAKESATAPGTVSSNCTLYTPDIR
jgi:cell division cycle 20-like protein 1 (cofactor of APC complex)